MTQYNNALAQELEAALALHPETASDYEWTALLTAATNALHYLRTPSPVAGEVEEQVEQDGAVEHGGWMPIESAPKGELITIWIAGTNVKGQKWCDGPGELWANCYYDSICGEWRTSRPSGHLRCVPERFVTHWMPQPTPPLDTKEG